ncbi:MAG: amidase family protein [Actinomycetes bacterium]
MPLSEEEVEIVIGLIPGLINSYEEISLQHAASTSSPVRAQTGMPPIENPHHAWTWKCAIPPTSKGALDGIKVAVKDNIAVAGLPMRAGSNVTDGWLAESDATVVTSLLENGAEIVGKSQCEDLCISGGSITSQPFPVHNPVRRNYSAGGSSSGSAVLVATGEVDLALGADQGGSIRIPASLCGVIGLKATFGAIPYTGVLGLEPSIDHVGPIARDIETIHQSLQALVTFQESDPRQRPFANEIRGLQDALGETQLLPYSNLRVALITEGFDLTREGEAEFPGSAASAELVMMQAEKLVALGATVDLISIPEHRFAQHVYLPILLEGGALSLTALKSTLFGQGYSSTGNVEREIVRGLSTKGGSASTLTKLIAILGDIFFEETQGDFYRKANVLRKQISDAYNKVLDEYDVLLCPTTAPAGSAVEMSGNPKNVGRETFSFYQNCCVTDVTGHPSISVPAGMVDGLPVGAMFVAKHFDEMTLLRASKMFIDSTRKTNT